MADNDKATKEKTAFDEVIHFLKIFMLFFLYNSIVSIVKSIKYNKILTI